MQWIINGPFHPAWSWWVLGCISLADIPGVPPAHKQYPAAEYEIMIGSLDPKCCPPDPDQSENLDILMPLDLQFHFDGVSDVDASLIAGDAVQAIVNGKLSPDQDYRSTWDAVLATTVAHYKAGLR